MKIYCVLPKMSSYEYKSDTVRINLKNKIEESLKWVIEKGMQPVFIKEDMLAVELLHDRKDIGWVSVIGEGDKHFLINHVQKYPEEYKHIECPVVKDGILRESETHNKIKNIRLCRGDIQEYNLARFNTLQNRITFASNLLLSSSNAVMQFRNNNNYTKEVKSYIGDGKLIITVELEWNSRSVSYGGVMLEDSLIDEVIGRI